jgi:hypothetical protein
VTNPANDRQVSSSPASTPNALLVWNNRARISLPLLLALWLALLVCVCLSSVFFVTESIAARWVLGGFVVSHLVVFLLPTITDFTMRRGFVSLMHVICWSPGLVVSLIDTQGRQANLIYEVWSYALITVISISFIFDLRDALTYLYYLMRGKVPTHDGET